jgi:hypothetical protein
MKPLSVSVALFGLLALVQPAIEMDLSGALLGSVILLCAATTFRSTAISSFLKIFVGIFSTETIVFGVAVLAGRAGLWPETPRRGASRRSSAVFTSGSLVGCAMIGLDRLISRELRVRAGQDLDLVAIGKIDRGIEDHLVAVLDAGAHLDGRTEVAHLNLGNLLVIQRDRSWCSRNWIRQVRSKASKSLNETVM